MMKKLVPATIEVLDGKRVFDLRPHGLPNKGEALQTPGLAWDRVDCLR